ncbi:MAG: ABC transporter ATP-binding protein [Fibrobacteres bacterium]|nr:ABC transporter ATP-binding protein [Fibrobacterota bacterium]
MLRLQKVCKSYRLGKEEIPVLRDVDVEVERGAYLAIMGPSGSGKSTLLHILGCLDAPTSGSYWLNGRAVHEADAAELARIRNQSIGFVFQNFNLLPRLNLAQNVELPLIYAGIAGAERKRLVQAMMERLGIWERRKHKPHEVSGGQKQRAAIARALVKTPDFILADEPTGNLDSDTTREILKLFSALHAEGHSIILITHEAEVAHAAGSMRILRDGRLLGAVEGVVEGAVEK